MNYEDMSDFQKRATITAIEQLLRGSAYFSISDLDAIADSLGVKDQLAGQDYKILRTLHCVHWSDMSKELRQDVRSKCLDLLGFPADIVDVTEKEPKQPTVTTTQSITVYSRAPSRESFLVRLFGR